MNSFCIKKVTEKASSSQRLKSLVVFSIIIRSCTYCTDRNVKLFVHTTLHSHLYYVTFAGTHVLTVVFELQYSFKLGELANRYPFQGRQGCSLLVLQRRSASLEFSSLSRTWLMPHDPKNNNGKGWDLEILVPRQLDHLYHHSPQERCH
jgi:hypothetical protein